MEGERNLTAERGPNVWDRAEWLPESGSRSRWLEGLGGAAIAITGAALAAVGGSMIYRASRGRGIAPTPAEPAETAALPQQASRIEDVVTRESAQSFPASDPPSWTPTVGTTLEKK